MIKNSWNVLYLLTIEVIFGALVIFPFFVMSGKEVPFLSYFIIMLSSSFLFTLLLGKYKDKGRILFFVLPLPVLLIGGNVMGFPIVLNLIISFLVFWRTLSHVNEQDKQNEGKWMLFTILLGIFLLFFAGAASPSYMKSIGVLMISQILFIIVGGFFRRWLHMDMKVRDKQQFILPFVSILSIIAVAGLLLTAGMNVIKWLFFSILDIGVFLVAFISKPFFNWAESQDWSKQFEKLNSNQGQEEYAVAQNELDEWGRNAFLNPTLILTIIFIAGLIFLFFYIYRHKKKELGEENAANPYLYTMEQSFLNEGTAFFRRGKTIAPTNPIRKEIYAFEKFAKKLHFGRKPFESLSDWMNRIGMLEYDEMNAIYEKVRYGDKQYTEKEAVHLKKKLEEKKQELKELKKLEKKSI